MSKLALLNSIENRPNASTPDASGQAFVQDFTEKLSREDYPALNALLEAKHGKAFLTFIGAHSPHISRLILTELPYFAEIAEKGVDIMAESFEADSAIPAQGHANKADLMKHLRKIKSRGALLSALADLTGEWDVPKVTDFLSALATLTLCQAADYLLLAAQSRGELEGLDKENPSKDSGLVILGMGKLGASELNYSSDIDIIVLYEPSKVQYCGNHTMQHCFNRLTRELVSVMQERTHDGYVFRTDIRLRPDPASTPPALSTDAAIGYYERVGQNWERAAMIKARAVAGDIAAGEKFLADLTPFMWRRYLDFASIADIYSIKRQIEHKIGRSDSLLGHNLKLGAGGIREIEFLVQVQQLIWGGRKTELRERATCKALQATAAFNILEQQEVEELIESYHFLRMMEHRVQMQRDQQTHNLPNSEEEFAKFADFAGFESVEAMEAELRKHLGRVSEHSKQFYGKEETLGSHGNLVFTGVDIDPETVANLTRMGFEQAETVCDRIMNWHRGHRRAVRNKRARELLTEITPKLLKEFSATANPHVALLKFDEFLDKLPAGVQIFSLFSAKPELLHLIATLMGSAPRLAEILSRNPSLLDGTLTGAFYEELPSKERLHQMLSDLLSVRRRHEDFINTLGQFKNEYEFQAGIQLMNSVAGYNEVAHFLSRLAEVLLEKTLEHISEEFAAAGYGQMPTGEMALLAMGKLGARELTFASDLDLIFIYDTTDPEARSDGSKPASPSVYYNRLFQRYMGMLTSLNREGRLYQVDTRLRPLGSDGPLAASFEAYQKYFAESAWTFERMAITRARVVYGSKEIRHKLEECIKGQVIKPRDVVSILTDANVMREKVATEFATKNPWDVKQIRGGMMDMDFIVQALQLIHANEHPDILNASTQDALNALAQANILPAEDAETLYEAYGFLSHILHLLRLMSHGTLKEETAPQGLKVLLTKQLGFEDFESLQSRLIKTQRWVYNYYNKVMQNEIEEE